MKQILELIKGMHPGLYLERELKKRSINQRQFAITINEFPQTINAIIKGKRSMNLELSLKIEKELNFDEGFLMTLQVFYDIKITNKKNQATPDLSVFRAVTFWDTKIDKIDWKKNKIAVITRVFAYGTIREQDEVNRFYGSDEVIRINKLYPERKTRYSDDNKHATKKLLNLIMQIFLSHYFIYSINRGKILNSIFTKN